MSSAAAQRAHGQLDRLARALSVDLPTHGRGEAKRTR
jgi:hypothetical protein